MVGSVQRENPALPPNTRAPSIGALVLAAFVAVTASCREVRVSAVDVATLEIEPMASLLVGDSAKLSARLLDGRQRAARTAVLKKDTRDYKDDTRTLGVLYYYRIGACNLAGCTYSNILSVAF